MYLYLLFLPSSVFSNNHWRWAVNPIDIFMEVLIAIDDVRLEHYSPGAKHELKKQLTEIASNLAEEANRIEMGRRLPTSNAEVT